MTLLTDLDSFQWPCWLTLTPSNNTADRPWPLPITVLTDPDPFRWLCWLTLTPSDDPIDWPRGAMLTVYLETQSDSVITRSNITRYLIMHNNDWGKISWWRKWKHFPRYWPFVRGIHRSPVNSPHKCQWLGALMFSFICAWINCWVNNRDADDLRRHRAHYDVIVMIDQTLNSEKTPLARDPFNGFPTPGKKISILNRALTKPYKNPLCIIAHLYDMWDVITHPRPNFNGV